MSCARFRREDFVGQSVLITKEAIHPKEPLDIREHAVHLGLLSCEPNAGFQVTREEEALRVTRRRRFRSIDLIFKLTEAAGQKWNFSATYGQRVSTQTQS